MYCSNCGEKLENDDQFCPACGQAIDEATASSLLSKPPVSLRTSAAPNMAKDSSTQRKTQQDQQLMDKYLTSDAPVRPKGTIVRIAAVVALVCFLFLPQVSCAGMGISGVDIFKLSSQTIPGPYSGSGPSTSGGTGDFTVVLAVLIIICGSGALLFALPALAAISAGLQLLLLIIIKSTEMGPAIAIQYGSFISFIAFIVSAFGRKIESFLNKNQQHQENSP